MSSRSRAATNGSKGPKPSKRRRKIEKSPSPSSTSQVVKQKVENWGLLEPFRGPLGPIVSIFRPFAGVLAVATILILLCIICFRQPVGGPTTDVGYAGYPSSARLAAFEEMWQKEESELWSWLEDRTGMDGLVMRDNAKHRCQKVSGLTAETKAKERQRVLGSKDIEARLRAERMSDREMEDAIRVTQERLDVLKRVMERKKSGER